MSGINLLNKTHKPSIKKDGYTFNPANPVYPVIRKGSENKEDSLSSSIKGWILFDLAFKSIGLAFSKAKRALTKAPPPANPLKLVDRFFTPNKIGREIGSNAIKQVKEKILPTVFKKPTKALQEAVSKVVGQEMPTAAKGFFGKTLKPLFKYSGAPFIIAIEMLTEAGNIKSEFQKGTAQGVKQLGKSAAKAGINTAGFVGGEIIGASIGAALGTLIAGPLGGQIGGWLGGLTGAAIGSYYTNKAAKTLFEPKQENIFSQS